MTNEYTADKDLFVDKNDQLVEANDPNKLRKLVGVGGTLSKEDAMKYGLLDSEGNKVEADSETAEGESVDSDSSLESLSVAELKEKAKEMGLTGYSSLNKADLIAAIEAGPQEEE